MNKITLIFILITCSFLFSCQAVKDGLSGRKSENSDEFLVKKKNPLVLPPDYMELPEPESPDNNQEIVEEQINVEDLIKNSSVNKEVQSKNYGKAENFVLENIK